MLTGVPLSLLEGLRDGLGSFCQPFRGPACDRQTFSFLSPFQLSASAICFGDPQVQLLHLCLSGLKRQVHPLQPSPLVTEAVYSPWLHEGQGIDCTDGIVGVWLHISTVACRPRTSPDSTSRISPLPCGCGSISGHHNVWPSLHHPSSFSWDHVQGLVSVPNLSKVGTRLRLCSLLMQVEVWLASQLLFARMHLL